MFLAVCSQPITKTNATWSVTWSVTWNVVSRLSQRKTKRRISLFRCRIISSISRMCRFDVPAHMCTKVCVCAYTCHWRTCAYICEWVYTSEYVTCVHVGHMCLRVHVMCVYVYMSCMYGYTSECACKYISNTVRKCSLDTCVHSIYIESCMEERGVQSSALSHLLFSAPMHLSTFVSLTLCTADPAHLCGTCDLAPSLCTYHLLTCSCRENKYVYIYVRICTRICIVYL